VYEAGAYRVRGILDAMRSAGVAIDSVVVGGGGAVSDAWNRIRADVYALPVRALPWREASTVGAAWIAGALLSRGTIPPAADEETRTWTPDARGVREYERHAIRYREIVRTIARATGEGRS
jgi:sugar (pentulose or hexulose) kinase